MSSHLHEFIRALLEMSQCSCTRHFRELDRQLGALYLEVNYLRDVLATLQRATFVDTPPPLYSEELSRSTRGGHHRRVTVSGYKKEQKENEQTFF